jgi:hypothetical protein
VIIVVIVGPGFGKAPGMGVVAPLRRDGDLADLVKDRRTMHLESDTPALVISMLEGG